MEPHNRNSQASVSMKVIWDAGLTYRFLGSITVIQFSMTGDAQEFVINNHLFGFKSSKIHSLKNNWSRKTKRKWNQILPECWKKNQSYIKSESENRHMFEIIKMLNFYNLKYHSQNKEVHSEK